MTKCDVTHALKIIHDTSICVGKLKYKYIKIVMYLFNKFNNYNEIKFSF